MAKMREHIDTWYKYLKSDIKPAEEDPEILGGRQAEDLLRNIVDGHYKFKGSHSFSAKRVPDKLRGGKKEIDLIVVTDKKLYILECKNWSGRLQKKGDKWIQYKRNSDKYIEHDDVVLKNEEKKNILIQYLNDKGIDVNSSDCVQKIILMNKNLAIDSKEIYSSPHVIPPDRLDSYLSRQKNRFSLSQKFFASVINLLLDEESSSKIIGGLFKRLGGHTHKQLIQEIKVLQTWDKVVLYGTKILSGDIYKSDKNIFKVVYKVPFKETKKIKVRIIRNKVLYLAKSIMAIGRPIGLDLYNYKGKLIYKTEANPNGVVRFRPAGSPEEEEIYISIFEIEEIIYGKEDYT